MNPRAFDPTAGKIRRSQAMSTFGVGAIVDLPTGSFMPLGLDHQDWHYSRLPQEDREVLTIHEPRLQRLLGVHEFRVVDEWNHTQSVCNHLVEETGRILVHVHALDCQSRDFRYHYPSQCVCESWIRL